MFGALSQGSSLFVLDKADGTPKLKIATVESSTYPTSYTNMPWVSPGQTLDLSVAFADGEKVKFEKLPASSSVYAYDKAVVTETRELMQQQVEAAHRQSKAVLDSIPVHERALVAYDGILKQLSPTYAKESQTDERLNKLEAGIDRIMSRLEKIVPSSVS